MIDRLSGDELPFKFDRDRAADRDDLVFCQLGHRLVTQSLRLLRAELWATGNTGGLARVTARTVATLSEVLEVGDVGVVCHARLVITGADDHRLHEELVVPGGRLRHARWSRIDTLRDLETLLRSATDEPVRWWDNVVEQGLNRAL